MKNKNYRIEYKTKDLEFKSYVGIFTSLAILLLEHHWKEANIM